MKNFIINILVIALMGFMLQYAWEYWQCGIFYKMLPQAIGSLMLSAVIGDVFITIALYLLLAFMNKDTDWILKSWKSKEYIVMILYSLFISFYFESAALYSNRWAYSDAMPLFLKTGIGLLPVLQLIILLPLTFLISKNLMRRLSKKF
ncbi:MAG: hypothetical protein ACM3X7_04580 [Solirubrobacterales bacterium]